MKYRYEYQHFFDNVARTDFKALSGNLTIYGAGFQGLLAAHLLDKQGIKVLCFCDMDKAKQGATYYGLPVYSPEQMKELYPDATVVVTPYSLIPAFRYVQNELGYKSVVTPYSLFLDFDSEEFDKLSELPDWYYSGNVDYHIDLFLRMCVNLLTEHTLYSADISVTEYCNLKCKNCTSLMPCYENPRHFTLDEMKYYIDTITKDRYFHHFNVEGGEAFVWKPLADFIDYLNNMPNLMHIYLYTNGTVIPDEKLLKVLSHKKVLVRISDYGKYSKIDELVKVFDKHNVRYKVIMQKWYELSAFSKTPKEGEALKRVTDTCCKTQPDGNGGPYVINGKMFYCPIQGNLHNLRIFVSPESDYIDLRENTPDLQERIERILKKERFPLLCKYCYGRTYAGMEVPPAVQLEKGETITVKFE